MEEEDVRGDRGLSVFRLRAVSRLTLVVRCTEIGYSVSTQVLGFRFGCGWCCVVGLFGCCWFCVLLLCVSAWWNRGIADEVTMASYGRAVTGTAVMARSANEEKKKWFPSYPSCQCKSFLFCKCHGIFSNPPRVLVLDDRQGLTASSAMPPGMHESLILSSDKPHVFVLVQRTMLLAVFTFQPLGLSPSCSCY